MNKRMIILSVALCILAVFIFTTLSWQQPIENTNESLTPATIPEMDDYEQYRYLSEQINENSMLPEIVDAFESMCRIPNDTYYDTYLLEAHTYENNGQSQFVLTLSYQFEVSWYNEFVEIGVDIVFETDEAINISDFAKFFEGDPDGLIKHLTESELYADLLERDIDYCSPFWSLW